ncbi:MAG: hypothetical protein QXL54_03240 [Candidatus Bathyarchaeia archaeon]
MEKSGVGKTFGYVRVGAYFAGDLGVRVWKRDSVGVETEITSGSPVAVVTFEDGDFHLELSATWNCPQTTLNPTDSIVVRVYARIPSGSGAWTLLGSGTAIFITEQLGAQSLDASTWTVYYVGSFTYDITKNRAGIEFHVDGNDNSRIANFKWSSAPTREWRNIDFISFNVKTRQWSVIQTETITVAVKQWNLIGTFIFSTLTRQWNNLQTAMLNLTVKQWQSLQTLLYTVLTKKWNFIDLLTFNLASGIVKLWHMIQNVIFNVAVEQWSILDRLTFTINLARLSLTVIAGLVLLTIIVIASIKKQNRKS